MILKHYGSFHPSDHAALITILVSRPSFAHVLLENIDKEKVPRKDLSALAVRQILSLNDAELSEHLRRVWGDSRESPEGKRAAIATLKATLQNQSLSKADPQAGRGTYAKLYGVGGTLGPDLTGSSRHNLDYLLTNMIDPSAVVTADYRMSVVHLTDGRVLGGLISQQSDRSITLRNPTESFVLVRDDIESIRDSGVSIMPEGQLALLSENEIRDLVAYLTSAVQVPLK
jgi:putative heme-binding domain-containing protein